MKEREPYKLTICRLLTLLLIVLVGIGSAANKVNGASLRGKHPNQTLNFDKHIADQAAESSPENSDNTQIRKHMLLNVCSGKLVKVFPKGRRKKVNARGTKKGKTKIYSEVWFRSISIGRMSIMGNNTQLYICFNRRGRLVARNKFKAGYCEFIEDYTDGNNYTRYRSAFLTRQWYLGFDENGKPLKGSYKSSKQDCYKFNKLDPPEKKAEPMCKAGEGRGPNGVDFCHHAFSDLFPNTNNKRRHSRSKQNHRKNG